MSGLDNISETIRTVSASTTATANDYNILVANTGTSITVTLPNSIPGRRYTIYKQGTTTSVTVQPASGTIDGNANVNLGISVSGSITVITDGTNWYTLEKAG